MMPIYYRGRRRLQCFRIFNISHWPRSRRKHLKTWFLIWFILYLYFSLDEIQVYMFNINDSPQRPSSWLLPRTMNADEYNNLMDLISSFLDHCQRADITVIMSFGTLVGSYMFHDVVPWDDDLDLWIPYTDLPKLKRHFRNSTIWKTHGISSWEAPFWEFDLDTLQTFPEDAPDSDFYRARHNDFDPEPMHVLKYYKKTSINPRGYAWKWPFLDVVTYREDETHVWNNENHDVFFIPKDKFYPLVLRPLGSYWIKAPADVGYILRSRYGGFSCKNNWYWHRSEHFGRWLFRRWLPCSLLWDVYPQVWSENLGLDWERETLKLGNKILHSYEIRTRVRLDQPSKRPHDF